MREAISILDKQSLSLEELLLNFGALHSELPFSKDKFVSLAERYPKLRMERESNGKITVMSPVKKGTSKREATLMGLLYMWNFQSKSGELFSPNAGFDLPDGSTKSPDAAWISAERAASADPAEEEEFISTVPDFVVEVRSSSDRLRKLQKKMKDTWMKNGVRLGWLIDPYTEQAFIYRQGREVETVAGFSGKSLSGEEVLPGFELDLGKFRQAGK